MPVCTTCGASYGSAVKFCVRDGTPLVTPSTDSPYLGTLLDGKYRIESFVSAGGMGSVYRAVHVLLDKTVAIKVIRKDLITSDDVVIRFQREARAASNLHHPNIVTVYDLGQLPDGTLYIAMEFIDGPSLKDVIRQSGPLAPSEAIDVVRQVASALSSAHRKQIVHRDLKPANLMLARVDGRTVVKLVDFGIAKTFDESTQLTVAGYMLGTPHYMSPEQAAGKPVDHRADLYSLGVILYETITGEVPFGDAAVTSVLVRLATETPVPPSARRPDKRVPPALDAVTMRCLEKEPGRRFQSADELADALESASAEIARGAVIGASPASAPETLVRPADESLIDTRPRGKTAMGPAGWRLGVVLLALGVAAAVIVGVFEMSRGPEESTAATRSVESTTDSPVPAPPAAPPRATLSGRDSPPSPASGIPAKPSGKQARRLSQQDESAAAPQPSLDRPEASESPRGDASAATDHTPSAIAPARPPAPAPTEPARTARSSQSLSVTCQGVPDVCAVIRSEIVRALRADALQVIANNVAADIELTASAALVSERPASQFGTPIMMRTYSIEVTAKSRGTPLLMPPPRIFEFDPVFSRAILQDNARLIADGVVEAVRVFTTEGAF